MGSEMCIRDRIHSASRHKVYDGTTTSVRHSQLDWLHTASPTFFRRSALHKDGSGRARSGSSEVIHSSSVSIRTDIPDAHVTRWPSGRARSRPPSAPLREGRSSRKVRCPCHSPTRCPIDLGSSRGHAPSCRACPRPNAAFIRPPQREREGHRGLSCGSGCRKDRAFCLISQLGSDFP